MKNDAMFFSLEEILKEDHNQKNFMHMSVDELKENIWYTLLKHDFECKKISDSSYSLQIGEYICTITKEDSLDFYQFFLDANDIWYAYRNASDFPHGLNLEEVSIFLKAYQNYLVEESKHDATQKFYHLPNDYTEKDVSKNFFSLRRSFLFVPINIALLVLLGLVGINLPIFLNVSICVATTYLSPFYFDKPMIWLKSKLLFEKRNESFQQKVQQVEQYQHSLLASKERIDADEMMEFDVCLERFHDLIEKIQTLPENYQIQYAKTLNQLLKQYRAEWVRIQPFLNQSSKNEKFEKLESTYNIRLSMLETEIDALQSAFDDYNRQAKKLDDVQLTLDEILGSDEKDSSGPVLSLKKEKNPFQAKPKL